MECECYNFTFWDKFLFCGERSECFLSWFSQEDAVSCHFALTCPLHCLYWTLNYRCLHDVRERSSVERQMSDTHTCLLTGTAVLGLNSFLFAPSY